MAILSLAQYMAKLKAKARPSPHRTPWEPPIAPPMATNRPAMAAIRSHDFTRLMPIIVLLSRSSSMLPPEARFGAAPPSGSAGQSPGRVEGGTDPHPDLVVVAAHVCVLTSAHGAQQPAVALLPIVVEGVPVPVHHRPAQAVLPGTLDQGYAQGRVGPGLPEVDLAPGPGPRGGLGVSHRVRSSATGSFEQPEELGGAELADDQTSPRPPESSGISGIDGFESVRVQLRGEDLDRAVGRGAVRLIDGSPAAVPVQVADEGQSPLVRKGHLGSQVRR